MIFCNFTTISISVNTSPLLFCDIYHPALSICLSDFNLQYACEDEIFLDFKSASYNDFNDFFYSINWIFLNNIDDCVDAFYQILFTAIDLFVPVRKKKRSNFPKWCNKATRLLITQKKIAHKKFKMSSSSSDYQVFSNLRNSCKEAIEQSKNAYISDVQQQIVNSTKTLSRIF